MIEEIKTFEERKEELIKKGKARGFITYEELANGLKGLDIDSDCMTTNIDNLFVAGEAVGGIHGKNRLMGNSLLDIIVFGRSAGINAAAKAKTVNVGKLTLSHIEKFEKEIADAGIDTEVVSPKLLPNYTNQKNI